MGTKTQKLIVLILVISLLIPNINYYNQQIKAQSTQTKALEPAKQELLTQENLSAEAEDFTNSPVLKYVNAESFNKKGHIKRLHDEEDLNTFMFKNADGTKTMYIMYENIKYIDKFGNIKDKDIGLKYDNGLYRVTDNNVKLTIPTNPLIGIELNYDNNIVRILPTKSLNNSKVTTTVANNAVTYKDYYGKGIDLRYTPLLSGVKEDIILNSYTQQEYSFTLDTKGLKVYEKEGKYYLAKDEKSESVYDIGEVLVYDAVGRPTYGDMKITCIEEGNKYNIIITVSDEYLKDELTVYPVTIDPTLTVRDASNSTNVIEDVPIFEGRATSNHGNFIYLSAGYVDGTYKVGRVLVRTPGLYNSQAYINTTQIHSAKFCCKDGSGNAASYVNLFPGTNTTWTETGATWSACSSAYSTGQNRGTTVSYGGFTEFDITHLVRSWKTNSSAYPKEAGFMLINSNETSASYRKAIFSSEYSVTTDRPYIEMTYESRLDISSSRGMVAVGGTHQLDYTTTITGATNTSWSYSSSDTRIATVDDNGVIRGVSEGQAYITGTYTFTLDETVRSLTDTLMIKVVDQTGIESGKKYFIRNKASGKLLTLNESAVTNLPEVSDFSKIMAMSSSQLALKESIDEWTKASQWEFVDRSQGLFSLGNVYASDVRTVEMCMDISTREVDLFGYDGGRYFKFNMYRINNGGMFEVDDINQYDSIAYNCGLYLISYNNMYMSYVDLGENEYDIVMTDYICDGSYWSITEASEKEENYWRYGDAKLYYTVTEYGDLNTEYSVVDFNDLEIWNYKVSNVKNSGINDDDSNANSRCVKQLLKESQIFVYRGHGIPGGLQICPSGRSVSGYLKVHENINLISNLGLNTSSYADYPDIGENVNDDIVSISSLENNSLNSARCVLYLGCQTGLDYQYDDDNDNSTPNLVPTYDHDNNPSTANIEYNLLEETYRKGAHFVLGTTVKTDPKDSEKFLRGFIAEVTMNPYATIKDCIDEGMSRVNNTIRNDEDKFKIIFIGDIHQQLRYGLVGEN